MCNNKQIHVTILNCDVGHSNKAVKAVIKAGEGKQKAANQTRELAHPS